MTFIARKQTGDMGFVWIEAEGVIAATAHCVQLGYHYQCSTNLKLEDIKEKWHAVHR